MNPGVNGTGGLAETAVTKSGATSAWEKRKRVENM